MCRQIDRKTSVQVRIDPGYHREAKIMAARLGVSLKSLLDGFIAERLGVVTEDCSK